MEFTGKDKDFNAVWNCNTQAYTIYYKGKLFSTKYKFSEILQYLN